MFIKLRNSSRRGFTIVEMMISMTLFGIAIAIAMSVYLFSTKTFAIMANFAQLDQNNRVALDKMTRELRGAQTIVTNSENSITLSYPNSPSVTYLFEPSTRALLRNVTGGTSTVMLTNCDLLTFKVGQRTPINGTWDNYPALPGLPVKEIQFRWKTGCTVPGLSSTVNEDIETAKIVVRMAGALELDQSTGVGP
jgi:prepilin-type N-terminal cleavage/methylation domain-containing protein